MFNFDLVDQMTSGNDAMRREIIQSTFPTAHSGFGYLGKKAGNLAFNKAEIIANILHVSLDDLSTTSNRKTITNVGDNNNLGNISINTDLASENRHLRLELVATKELVKSKEETIAVLKQLCQEKGIRLEETTQLYEKHENNPSK